MKRRLSIIVPSPVLMMRVRGSIGSLLESKTPLCLFINPPTRLMKRQTGFTSRGTVLLNRARSIINRATVVLKHHCDFMARACLLLNWSQTLDPARVEPPPQPEDA